MTTAPRTLTQRIHDDLISDGKMKSTVRSNRDRLVSNRPEPHARRDTAHRPWHGDLAKKPWEYRVTAAIPHRNTLEHLKLCLEFVQAQTEQPYIMIIDTGSDEATLPDVLALRSDNVEVHQIACQGTEEYADVVCYAMDLAMSACRTEYLWCLHSDCFVTNRGLLAEMLSAAAGGKQPVIGYESTSANKHPQCKGMVSHTCTLLHMPTMHELDVTWSRTRLAAHSTLAGRDVIFDPEMALNYRLRDRGISPLILGPEQAGGIERDANRVHLRSGTLAEEISRTTSDSRTGYDAIVQELWGKARDFAQFPLPAIERRNLIFYLLPLRNPAHVWQWHVKQLRQYLPLFNGRRIVTIGTQEGDGPLCLDPPPIVKRAFGADAASVEFFEIPNDRNRWETPAFLRMLSSVESVSPNEASFYFHAKGVRRLRQAAVRPWCEEIYRHNLARIDEAMSALRNAKACGAIRRSGDPTQVRPHGAWHYSGTGFWFRHDTLFSRSDWRELSEHSHAVEAYLSTLFSREECHCLAHDDDEGGGVYDPATWRGNRLAAPTVSVLVTARNYGRYLRDCLESCFWQRHQASEVLYVDDASDDDSLIIAREFESLGLRVLCRDRSEGVEAARNFAARHSSGETLLFVDGDNILPVDYLERMVAVLTFEAPFVYPDLVEFGCDARFHRQPEYRERDLSQGHFIDTCSLIWREAFDAVGGWMATPVGFLEDWHLFLRLSHLGEPRRAGVALCYRRHSNSRTNQHSSAQSPRDAAEVNSRIVSDVSRWSTAYFGRILGEVERRLGLLGICERESSQL